MTTHSRKTLGYNSEEKFIRSKSSKIMSVAVVVCSWGGRKYAHSLLNATNLSSTCSKLTGPRFACSKVLMVSLM